MTPYKNLEGHSGVSAYELGTDSITIEFNHDAIYLYTYSSTGKRAVEKMKKHAQLGKGLSTYISQSVRENFERKLK